MFCLREFMRMKTYSNIYCVKLLFFRYLSAKSISKKILMIGQSQDRRNLCLGLCPEEIALVPLTQQQKQSGRKWLIVLSSELIGMNSGAPSSP